MRALVVGQAMSRSGRWPLDGASGRRLCRLLGRPVGSVADVANLVGGWPGAAEKGDRFLMVPARRAAASLLERDRQHRRLVLLGRNVADAFGLGDQPFFKWRRLGPRLAVVFPHPSGISHWWNAPGNAARARRFLRDALCSGHGKEPSRAGEEPRRP